MFPTEQVMRQGRKATMAACTLHGVTKEHKSSLWFVLFFLLATTQIAESMRSASAIFQNAKERGVSAARPTTAKRSLAPQAQYCKVSPAHTACKYARVNQVGNCHQIKRRGLTSKDIAHILELHNSLRAKVASGKESDQPPAANMAELTWDDEAASIAQTWADQCIFQLDELRSTVKNTTAPVANGQNIAHGQGNSKYEFVTDAVFKKWFNNQVKLFKPSGIVANGFRPDGTSQYTQMVWATTRRVGCGYVDYGNNEQLLYCNYVPGGNRFNQPVYKTGEPCSACPTDLGECIDGALCGTRSGHTLAEITLNNIETKWNSLQASVCGPKPEDVAHLTYRHDLKPGLGRTGWRHGLQSSAEDLMSSNDLGMAERPIFSTSHILLGPNDHIPWFRMTRSSVLLFWHKGSNILVHSILPNGTYEQTFLGDELGDDPTVAYDAKFPLNTWLAMETHGHADHSRVPYTFFTSMMVPGYAAEYMERGTEDLTKIVNDRIVPTIKRLLPRPSRIAGARKLSFGSTRISRKEKDALLVLIG